MSDQSTATSPATTSPATTSPAAPNPGVAIQHAIHGAVRRDMHRLVEALSEDTVAAGAVTEYAAEFLDHLHHHHTFEDADVWPEMGRRLGEAYTTLLERNAAEHEDITAAVTGFSAALDRVGDDPAPAHAAAIHMREVVFEHLAHEEAEVIPLIPKAFALEEFPRFQAASAKLDPPPRFLPWLLESAPEPMASAFAAQLPPPVREQLTTTWMPVWQAKVDALLTPATAT